MSYFTCCYCRTFCDGCCQQATKLHRLIDFAGCASDDLIGWSERKDGETKRFDGTFKDFPVSREEAEDMIMQARIKACWINAEDLPVAEAVEATTCWPILLSSTALTAAMRSTRSMTNMSCRSPSNWPPTRRGRPFVACRSSSLARSTLFRGPSLTKSSTALWRWPLTNSRTASGRSMTDSLQYRFKSRRGS